MKFIKIKKLIITILIFLTPISLIISQEESETSNPLILYMDKIYDVIPHAEIYEDKTGNLSFEEVIEKEFKPSNQNSYNFGFTSSVYWLRFQIKNQNSFLNDDWIFFVEYPQLDSVNFYFPIDHEQEEEDVYIEKEGGDQLPFAKRDIESRVLNFTVPFEISKDPVIYMRVHSISVMQIPVYLAPQRLFHMRDNETQIIMGIYFGIMLIMGFYNLFLFFSLREKIYLYYVHDVFDTHGA
jgi:hypothetical protein